MVVLRLNVRIRTAYMAVMVDKHHCKLLERHELQRFYETIREIISYTRLIEAFVVLL